MLQVDRASARFKFDSTVAKWLGYMLAAIIVVGLSIVAFYLHDNYVYFSSYFARLTHPLAAVEPLPPTTLAAITEDIVTEPGSVVTFAAAIKSRVPETGNLVLATVEGEPADGKTKRI